MNPRSFNLHRYLLFLAVLCMVGLSSCVCSTGNYFKNLGRQGQCILMETRADNTLELYRGQNKIYAKGTLTTFREYDPVWVSDINRADLTYKLTSADAPRQTVYQELQLVRFPLPPDSEGKSYLDKWQSAGTPYLTELPEGARPYHSRISLCPEYPHVNDGGNLRPAIMTEQTEATLHALYAYPMAAVCYAGIDAPVMVAQGLVAVVVLPFVGIYYLVD